MACCNLPINKNFICDKAICIPTNGKPYICVCENENGDIVQCYVCKCFFDTCQCKCEDSKCTCIVTKGADCICVYRDKGGNIKGYDCCAISSDKEGCCKKEVGSGSCRQVPETGAYDGQKCSKDMRRDLREFKANTCIPTNGKPCICVCEDENGDIVQCNDCKCFFDTCQCKCDDSKCTCIVTKGADCICVYRDKGGNIKGYDCCAISSDKKGCCKKEVGSGSCCKVPE